MLIDSHCHLTKQFLDDPTETIKRARGNGVEKMICVGTSLEDSKEAIQIAQDFEGVYASVGIHPDSPSPSTSDWSEFEKLIFEPKVMAIGECGLDFKVNRDHETVNGQKAIFMKQLELAKKYRKPLIVHCREAQGELKEILDSGQNDGLTGVFHCFFGNQEYLDWILRFLPGFYVSFAGNVTFKNAKGLQELAMAVPLERMLTETDSPFLSPEPLRGSQNEPKNVKIVAQFPANLKGVSFEELEKTTSSNAIKLFNL